MASRPWGAIKNSIWPIMPAIDVGGHRVPCLACQYRGRGRPREEVGTRRKPATQIAIGAHHRKKDAGRLIRTVTGMTTDEAELIGIAAADRPRPDQG
jgi:hypothetical protein